MALLKLTSFYLTVSLELLWIADCGLVYLFCCCNVVATSSDSLLISLTVLNFRPGAPVYPGFTMLLSFKSTVSALSTCFTTGLA